MIRTIKQVAKYVYKTLGPGHEEAIYRDAMSVELQDRGYTVKTEAPVSIQYTTKKGKKNKRGQKWVRDLKNWFRIEPYYYFVILLDGLLFMLIHVGKPLSEVLTAFPGGVFLGLLAFKFKSFLPCYLIHTMTAGTIIFLIMIFN